MLYYVFQRNKRFNNENGKHDDEFNGTLFKNLIFNNLQTSACNKQNFQASNAENVSFRNDISILFFIY